MSLKELASQIGQRDRGLRLRTGVVDAVGSGTVDITLGGSTVVIEGVSHLASYSPTAADVVAILQDPEGALLVLGDFA